MLKRRTLTQLFAAASLAPAVGQAQGHSPLTRIAFGSCAEQRRPQPIWDAVLAYQPDLFIFAGDNVYGDFNTADAAGSGRPMTLPAQIAGYARLRDKVPHLAVWDDHDYGRNDGGADFPHKAVAKDEFLSFWNVPADDVRRTREGIYSAHIIGPPGMRVQVILLDLRWFRSPLKRTDQRDALGKERYMPDADPAKTMLGDEQWAWLARRAAKARRGAAAGVLASRCWPRAMAGSVGAISRSSARNCSTRSAPATPTASCCCRATAISARSIARRQWAATRCTRSPRAA